MPAERFQNQYRIPSSRATWHEYNGGMYFVTVCTQNKEHYFGEIQDGVMHLTEIGEYKPSPVMPANTTFLSHGNPVSTTASYVTIQR